MATIETKIHSQIAGYVDIWFFFVVSLGELLNKQPSCRWWKTAWR